MLRRILFGFALSCLLSGGVLAQQPQEAISPTKATTMESLKIENLTWIQGRWISRNAKQIVEEQWSLQGQSLLGVSRTMEAEKSKALEILMLEKKDDDWIMRLRFFGPAIDKASRGKDEPLRLKLVEADHTHFTCIGIGAEEGTTLTYTLKNAQILHAKITKMHDGKIVWGEEFEFVKSNDLR